jgi:hypothetical protein
MFNCRCYVISDFFQVNYDHVCVRVMGKLIMSLLLSNWLYFLFTKFVLNNINNLLWLVRQFSMNLRTQIPKLARVFFQDDQIEVTMNYPAPHGIG